MCTRTPPSALWSRRNWMTGERGQEPLLCCSWLRGVLSRPAAGAEGRFEAEPGGHAPDPHRAAERPAAGNAQRQGLAFLACLRPIDPCQPVGRPADRAGRHRRGSAATGCPIARRFRLTRAWATWAWHHPIEPGAKRKPKGPPRRTKVPDPFVPLTPLFHEDTASLFLVGPEGQRRNPARTPCTQD